MQRDLILDTAKLMEIHPKDIFINAAKGMLFTNAEDVGEYRYLRWFKYGEIPFWVKLYCHDSWRPKEVQGCTTHSVIIG